MLKVDIKIENVVANARLTDSLDLEYIESELEDAMFTRKKFPGLVYRTRDPKAAFLIFRSGKVVCTGSKTEAGVRKVIDLLAAALRSIGIKVEEHPEFKVQNIVASANLGRELNLGAIVIGLELEGMEYEPEVFPGLVYRINEPKSAILIFSSGRLVITGGKTMEDCEKSVKVLLDKLTELELI
jgi:transcription initiation factor TFIID TATA-box-binding protein